MQLTKPNPGPKPKPGVYVTLKNRVTNSTENFTIYETDEKEAAEAIKRLVECGGMGEGRESSVAAPVGG